MLRTTNTPLAPKGNPYAPKVHDQTGIYPRILTAVASCANGALLAAVKGA